MTYRILTTINKYKDGKPVEVELPLPKDFPTLEVAEAFGLRFFEPPVTVLAWRVVMRE